MSLRAVEPVSRVALNTIARPSGVKAGWLLLPLSLVSFIGVPVVRRLPDHLSSTSQRLTGLGVCACRADALTSASAIGRYGRMAGKIGAFDPGPPVAPQERCRLPRVNGAMLALPLRRAATSSAESARGHCSAAFRCASARPCPPRAQAPR